MGKTVKHAKPVHKAWVAIRYAKPASKPCLGSKGMLGL